MSSLALVYGRYFFPDRLIDRISVVFPVPIKSNIKRCGRKYKQDRRTKRRLIYLFMHTVS